MSEIKIADRAIGEGHQVFLIAEVAQAHDGSLGTAHAFIDAAAEAGADAVKFQTHIASEESTLDEKFRVKFSRQDETRYDYWRRMEFSPDQWAGLAQHATENNLVFLSSPFSIAAVNLLDEVGMPAWKVGSGEFRSMEMLSAMIKTGNPVLFSTGMSNWQEIDSVVEILTRNRLPYALFQTTSQYPVPSESVGLNVLDELRLRYPCPVGLSDHTGKVFAPLAAMARGANLIEVHVTFDKRMFGPDVPASLTVEELALLAKARDEFHVMNTHPVDKDNMANQLAEMRDLFSKSVALSGAIPAGTTLTEAVLVPRKPGTGIPYTEIHQLIGRKLIKDVSPDRLLRWEDVETRNA